MGLTSGQSLVFVLYGWLCPGLEGREFFDDLDVVVGISPRGLFRGSEFHSAETEPAHHPDDAAGVELPADRQLSSGPCFCVRLAHHRENAAGKFWLQELIWRMIPSPCENRAS